MRRPWLLVIVVLLGAILAAHAGGIARAWRGETVYAYALDRCDSHFVVAAAPVARVRPLADGCDTIYSQRMAWDGWRRAREAWAARTSAARFVVADLWRVAMDARALNLLDLVLFVWPARLLFTPAPALAVLHLGLVALGALSGVVYARLLGTSALAGLAAGVVVGGSGTVLEGVLRGQYPQAVVIGALLFFAGLARVVNAERGGVALTTAGAAIAALLYWQNGLILGVGAVLFLAGRRAGGALAPGTVRRLALAAAVTGVVCLPGAWPVIAAMVRGSEDKLALAPWGTPFPSPTGDKRALSDLIDEVPWFVLFSPRRGWIPVLPLLPVMAVGLARRDRLGWVAIALFGGLMALGPLPVVPEGVPGPAILEYGAMGRIPNPLYELVYQWVPTASRMRHPMRWGQLVVVGVAALTALGVDGVRARWPNHVGLAVGAGLVWAVGVGPWPLRESPFPSAALHAVEGCSSLFLSKMPHDERRMDDIHRLEGLTWLPRAPATAARTGGVGVPTPAMDAWAEEQQAAFDTALLGEPAPALAGACVLYEPSWVGPAATLFRAQLVRAFGPPAAVIPQVGLLAPEGGPRQIEVFRVP